MEDFFNFNDVLISINYYCFIFLHFMKYIFSFFLLLSGIFILLTLKRENLNYSNSDKVFNFLLLRKYRFVIGVIYIILAFGILFNFLLYLLLWVLPEGFIYIIMNSLIQYYNFDFEYLENVFNILQQNILPILSFLALMNLFICLYYYLNNKLNKNPRKTTYWFLSSMTTGLLVGFSTCIPYLL